MGLGTIKRIVGGILGRGERMSIEIMFSHARPEPGEVWTSNNGGLPIHATTKCEVVALGYGGGGHADCSIHDQFSRAKGRKIALTRAIARFPKSVRRQVWEAYFKRVAR